MGVALPRRFGWTGMVGKIFKNIWTIAYLMQKMGANDVWTNVKVHNNLKMPQTVTQKNRLIE